METSELMRRRKPRKIKGPATYFRGPRWQPKDLPDGYPFTLPAVRDLEKLRFEKPVTFLVGENGSGKSTILEAIAIRAGFNAEGGSRNFNFSTWNSHSELSDYIALERGFDRMRDGYFLRAESFYNVATQIKVLDVEPLGGPPVASWYGNRGLHEQSHGESFFALFQNRFHGHGLYFMDEPEAALSFRSCLALMALLDEMRAEGSQVIVATHSPLLVALPGAALLELGEWGIRPAAYDDLDVVRSWRAFLDGPEAYLRHLLG